MVRSNPIPWSCHLSCGPEGQTKTPKSPRSNQRILEPVFISGLALGENMLNNAFMTSRAIANKSSCDPVTRAAYFYSCNSSKIDALPLKKQGEIEASDTRSNGLDPLQMTCGK